MLMDNGLRRLLDKFGLLPEKAGRVDGFFQFCPVGPGQGDGIRIFGKENRRHLVNPYIGALGGEDDGR